ncbi:hypothetical protein AOG1_15550 [Geobacter sp. AOG1]|nr:hypothetical protein AOG1_15550 [Geobacter sp. AOG1]
MIDTVWGMYYKALLVCLGLNIKFSISKPGT